MNKQLVNLIGAAASALILVLGIVVFALPQFSSAQSTARSAGDVARQNRTQQTLLDTLTAQSAGMAELDAAVAELRAEIPAAAHLDDVLLLAVRAAQLEAGTVTSLTPVPPEAFTPRDEAVVAAAGGGAPVPAPAPAPATGESATGTTETPDASPDEPAADPADAPRQVSVTIVVEAADVAAATRILDELRSGPRLVAVTKASVATASEGGATLTATLLAFYRP